MPAPRTSAPSTTTGSDALLYLLFGILGIALAFGSLAWLSGNLTNSALGGGLGLRIGPLTRFFIPMCCGRT